MGAMRIGCGSTSGSFRQNLDRLLEELNRPAKVEIGTPEPADDQSLLTSAARSPAAHNYFLLDRTQNRGR
jgi:hypothetical protein